MEELYKKFNYPSLNKFQQILKRNNIFLSYKEVQNFIDKQSIKQIHKPIYNVKSKQKFIFSLEPYESVQIDLLDYQKYSSSNKNFKFILIAVDIFSRKAFSLPLKNKTPDSVLQAFIQFKIKPISIFHDSGKEFLGSFLKYINDNNIVNLVADIGNHNSLGVIDRFSKTLKGYISKYMDANDTVDYVSHLHNLIESYNDTPHNSLGELSPNDVFKNKDDYDLVFKINLAKLKFNKDIEDKNASNKLKVGDSVRVQIEKKLFRKGYEITFTKKIFIIESITDGIATLNDDSKHKLKYLMYVNSESSELISKNKDRVENKIKSKRLLDREGI